MSHELHKNSIALCVSGLLFTVSPCSALEIDIEGDAEFAYERNREAGLAGTTLSSDRESLTTLDLELDLEFSKIVSVHAGYESEYSSGGSGRFNALYLKILRDSLELRAGRQDDLFAHSETAFLSSPFTEIWELEAEAVSARWAIGRHHNLKGFLYQTPESTTNSENSHSGNDTANGISAGISYRSETVMEDVSLRLGMVNRMSILDEYAQLSDTAGLHMASILDRPRTRLLLEYTRALGGSNFGDVGFLYPEAALVEFVATVSEKFETGVRLEHTRELPNAPTARVGLISLLSVSENFVMGAEISRSFFSSNGLQTEDPRLDEVTDIELSLKFEF